MLWRKRYFAVSEYNCTTDQVIPGLKSVARCSDAILRANSLRVRLKMSCAKFGVNWTRNAVGVAKRQLSGFRDFAKKFHRCKWAWPMPKDAADSSESVGITFWTVGGSVWEL